MKFSSEDLVKLRGGLILCLLLSAAGGAAVFYALKEHKVAMRELVAAEQRRSDTENRLRLVSSEEREIKEKTALFQQLQTRGIIGTENRLDWVELLRETREKLRLYDVEYEILPQQQLDTTAGHQFHLSPMRLDMRLLHEEDLLRLLQEVRTRATALVLPRECSIARLPQPAQSDRLGPQPQLTANCTLQWITVRGPEKKS